jgi:outer membrane lipoprotein carrier protein
MPVIMDCRHFIIAVSIAVSGWCSALSASEPADVQLQDFFRDLKTLSATFEQQVVDADGAQIQQVRGHMWLQRPDRFRWDYQQPYHQLIVGDGQQVWVYDEDLEQVTVRPLDAALGQTPALLLSSDKPILDVFSVMALGSRDGVDWLLMRPRDTDATFDELRLGLVNGRLQAMELRDGLGHTTLLHFSELERNRPINPDLFVFTPPAGVDVVRDIIAGPGAQD